MTGSLRAIYRLPRPVLEDICRTLHATYPEDRLEVGRRTVAALAVTARLFQEPALDVLWYTIPDIAVLFYTLPKDLYCVVRGGRTVVERTTLFRFADSLPGGTPKESQLKQFFAYARRVRRLDFLTNSFISAGQLHTAPEAYSALASVLGPRVLLPNVHTINVCYDRVTPPGSFVAFHILFGSKLERLRVWHTNNRRNLRTASPPFAKEYANAVTRIFQRLRLTTPLLREVNILLAFGCGSMGSAALADTVCSLKHLVSLRLGTEPHLSLTPPVFAHLAKLPHLGTLTFYTPDSADSWAAHLASLGVAGGPQCKLFPALRELYISAPTFALSTELLHFVGSPCLSKLIVIAKDAIPRHEIDPLFTAVAALPSRQCISSFRADGPRVVRGPALPTGHVPAPFPIGRGTLEPLLALGAMEELCIKICCPFDVDDTFLEDCGKAWPRLFEFALGGETAWGMLTDADFEQVDDTLVARSGVRGHDSASGRPLPAGLEVINELMALQEDSLGRWRRPRATLFGLLALAQHCPRLSMLQVEFNAILDPDFVPPARLETRPILGQPPAWFELLNVGLSPIDDPYAVAAFLSDAFPRLYELGSGWRDMEEKNRDPEDDNDDDDGVDYDDDTDEAVVPECWWSVARMCRKRWQKVLRLVKVFRFIREQERRWKRKAVMGAAETVDQGLEREDLDI